MTELKEDFVVQCAVCKQRYTNHAGSTECCGSVAELLDDNMEPVGSWVYNVKIENSCE